MKFMIAIKKKYAFPTLLFLATITSNYADGASTQTLEILPYTKIDDRKIGAKVTSLINTFNLLRGRSESTIDSRSLGEINFYFVSGENYIISERVSKKALTAFQEDTAEEISALPTNTDTCYVQNFRFDRDQKITVVVHNEDYDYQDDVYRCLVAGLWWFTYQNLNGFDSINWKKSFLELL